MSWQEHSSIIRNARNFTVWRSGEAPRYWAVTEDRDGRGVTPRNDYNHQLTKSAAISNLDASLMREWSPDIDPATIPDAVILSERARRNSAKRATRSGGRNGGRPKGSKNKPTDDPSPKHPAAS